MNSHVRKAVAPAFLFVSLMLGGSTQNSWPNLVLELLGAGILVWAAFEPAREALDRPARQLLILATIALAIVGMQLIPLPATLWPHLGGREALATDFRILGIRTPSLSLSLTPNQSLDALLKVIPALAIFCAIVRLRAYRASWLGVALLAATVAGVLIEALQVSSRVHPASSFYFFPALNPGDASGLFADANHMAVLLVIALPFLAALLACAHDTSRQRRSIISGMIAVTAVSVVIGIALNRSLAAYALGPPVLVASALLILPLKSSGRRLGLVIATVLLIAAVAFISTRPINRADSRPSASQSIEPRGVVLKRAAQAARDFMPFGSGLGSFATIYQLYGSRDQVRTRSATHAHNDYLELALELGIPGIMLMIAFLAWWGMAAWRAWQCSDAGSFARAASIASAAILMYSFVDFPLRTAAISTAFLMCLALLVEPRSARGSELWPTRHVVLT